MRVIEFEKRGSNLVRRWIFVIQAGTFENETKRHETTPKTKQDLSRKWNKRFIRPL